MAAARTLALGVDYASVLDQDREDFLIHVKVLRLAEKIVKERRQEEADYLLLAAMQGVTRQLV